MTDQRPTCKACGGFVYRVVTSLGPMWRCEPCLTDWFEARDEHGIALSACDSAETHEIAKETDEHKMIAALWKQLTWYARLADDRDRRLRELEAADAVRRSSER